MNTRLLAGLKCIDLTRLLPGPLCTQFFCDLGAEVIKIEDPDSGDYARTVPPMLNKNSRLFCQLNRGKKSVVLNLKSSQHRERFNQLIRDADVLVESFRPGVMDHLGISFSHCQKINPKLVFCSITGFGQQGPLSSKAGHDLNYLALAGVLGQSNSGSPAFNNFQIADVAAGALQAATSILAAVISAHKNHQGCHLDVSMLHGTFALQSFSHAFGELAGPANQMLNGGLAYYGLYETKDKKWMALAALEDKFWRTLVNTIGRTDLLEKNRDQSQESQMLLRQDLSRVFLQKTRDEWATIFASADCCCTPVLSYKEAMNSQVILTRGNYFIEENTIEGAVPHILYPVKIDGKNVEFSGPAPS